jgi:hypothetical protein
MKTAKKRPIRRPNPAALSALMEEWPASWAGLDEDEEPGRRLLAELRPFIMHLIDRGLAAKTVRRHLDNLWAIGGEVIRRFNFEPELRQESARRLLLDAVDFGEAPLLPHATEAGQHSADATARKLFKFLLATPATPPS